MTITQSPLRLMGWGLAAAILLTPAIAMQFTDEVAWSSGDFLVMALMLLAAGLAIELMVRAIAKGGKRTLAILAVVGLFLWLWAELAVGVFTSWGS